MFHTTSSTVLTRRSCPRQHGWSAMLKHLLGPHCRYLREGSRELQQAWLPRVKLSRWQDGCGNRLVILDLVHIKQSEEGKKNAATLQHSEGSLQTKFWKASPSIMSSAFLCFLKGQRPEWLPCWGAASQSWQLCKWLKMWMEGREIITGTC